MKTGEKVCVSVCLCVCGGGGGGRIRCEYGENGTYVKGVQQDHFQPFGQNRYIVTESLHCPTIWPPKRRQDSNMLLVDTA